MFLGRFHQLKIWVMFPLRMLLLVVYDAFGLPVSITCFKNVNHAVVALIS